MSTGHRIRVLAGVMFAAVIALLLHLFVFMVGQGEVWAKRSQDNRWAFRSVPSMRGALLDRTGRSLAWDEPSTELALYYSQWRRYHVVGAAVHAATLTARLPGGDGRSYSYLDGPVGPMAAVVDLLSLPARVLRPGHLPKGMAGELATTITTVLSGCAGCSRKRAYTAVREASQQPGIVQLGDVLDDTPRTDLLAAFARIHDTLADLELQLHALGRGGAPPGKSRASLFDALEQQRRPALGIGVPPDESEEDEYARLRRQTRLAVFAEQVPFELAASLKLGASNHAGIVVQPSVRRVSNVDPGTSLGVWLGRVVDLDRTLAKDQEIEDMAGLDPPDGGAELLVPENFDATEGERKAFEVAATSAYRRAMLGKERKGIGGLESSFDDDLRGQLGMRFVERDSSRREHVLFGSLQVASGSDVQLTIDAELQGIVEQQVRRYHEIEKAQHEDLLDQERIAAAMAMIDAHTGDILAYAAMQNELHVSADRKQREWRPGRRPGVGYGNDPSLGSVVKPFVLIEHLRAEALGQTGIRMAQMQPCEGKWEFGRGEWLGCGHRHGDAGRNPIAALEQSCNTFFFQATLGLGEAGLHRALQRFGLGRDDGAGEFAATWMARVPSLPPNQRPRMDQRVKLPMRGIGYGVHALPVDVARAYAALATGYLPTLGVVLGEGRDVVPLGDYDAELRVVREGLRQCVVGSQGTARKVDFPAGLEVFGKTGTAEVGRAKANNAWFAGFLGHRGRGGVQIAFAAVVYGVKDGRHGDGTGHLVADVLRGMQGDTQLQARYLVPEGGR